MSKLRKYKRKALREGKDNPATNLPYMSILFVVIIIAIFGSAAYIVMSKSASQEPEDKDAIKMTISISSCKSSHLLSNKNAVYA